MKRSEYLIQLQKPFDWDLGQDEADLAVEMAKKHTGRKIIQQWHQFQKEHPCSTFQEFKNWFEGTLQTANVGPKTISLFEDFYNRIGYQRRKNIESVR